MKDRLQFLKDIICKILKAESAEKFLAYDIFINRIVQSLKYEETIRIPHLGYFQLKKGNLVDNKMTHSDVLVFVPLNKFSDELDFAYLNIFVKEKGKSNEPLEFNVFSLSVNKPLVSNSKQLFTNKNETISTSLFTVQKEIEDKVNELIKKSDFLDGLNLWEDFFINDKEQFGVNDELFVNDTEDNLDVPELMSLDLSFTNNQLNLNSEENTLDIERDDISLSGPSITNNNESVSSELFSDISFNNSEIVLNELNTEDFDINLITNNTDNIIDNLNLINSNNEAFDSDKLTNIESKDNILEDTTNKNESINPNKENINQETDWTKELEEELFSDIKEEINLSDEEGLLIPDSNLNDNEDDTIGAELNNLDNIENLTKEDLLDIKNDSDVTLENSVSNKDENNNLNKDNINISKTDNIDELFDQLLNNNPKDEKQLKSQSNKFSTKKVLIYLSAFLLIITIIGLAYYFFFYKSKNEVKNEINKENLAKTEKNITTEASKSEVQNLEIKKDTLVNTKEGENINNPKQVEKLNTEQQKETKTNEVVKIENNKPINETQPNETLKKNESKTDVETKKNSISLNSDLYRELTNDKQIVEKIYFDGKKYHIQTSSLKNKIQAENEAKRLRAKGIPAYIVKVNLTQLRGIWYRIKIFDFNSKEEAEAYIKKNKL